MQISVSALAYDCRNKERKLLAVQKQNQNLIIAYVDGEEANIIEHGYTPDPVAQLPKLASEISIESSALMLLALLNADRLSKSVAVKLFLKVVNREARYVIYTLNDDTIIKKVIIYNLDNKEPKLIAFNTSMEEDAILFCNDEFFLDKIHKY